MANEPVVTHNEDKSRYEVRVDDTLAGFAEYQISGNRIRMTHTEVDPSFEGKGVGSALVRGALDDIRSSTELRVIPVCPFVESWIARHPEYQDLVDVA